MNTTKIISMKYRKYTITWTTSHIVIHSPEGYLRYEMPLKYNNTQDALDTIDEDIKSVEYFRGK